MNGNNSKLLARMLGFHATVWAAHWIAATKTNEHKALGDLYESWGGSLDSLAELSMGKTRDRAFSPEQASINPQVDYAALVDNGLSLVESFRDTCETGEDDDVLNVLADMSHALNKASYMLQL